jgi:hypothetical protein
MNLEQAILEGATHYNLMLNEDRVQNYFKLDERGLWYFWGCFDKWVYMVNLNDKNQSPNNVLPIENLI